MLTLPLSMVPLMTIFQTLMVGSMVSNYAFFGWDHRFTVDDIPDEDDYADVSSAKRLE